MNAMLTFIGSVFNFLLPVSIFSVYVAEGNILTGTIVFTSLAWLSQMQWSLQALPGFFQNYADMMPTLRRLSDFLTEGMDVEHPPSVTPAIASAADTLSPGDGGPSGRGVAGGAPASTNGHTAPSGSTRDNRS